MKFFSSVSSMENGVNVLQWMENNEITAPSHWSILKIWLHQSDYIKCFCNKAPHMGLMYSVLLPSSMIRVVIHIQKRSKKNRARCDTHKERNIISHCKRGEENYTVWPIWNVAGGSASGKIH